MPDPAVARLHEWLRAHEGPLLEEYRSLLRIPSIEDAPAPNAPFGKANRDALDYALNLGDACGMRTKDIEGYCGYAEFGSGDKLIMCLGHLDVVPVGPGWKHDPFGAEIDGGYVYARGAIDDKGPTIAGFYAMRAIQECLPDLGVRMRTVFGCNEESGFQCVERYVQTEEAPTFGIAPDSGWPLYHGEKGIANAVVDWPLPQGGVSVLTIEGGQRPNIVIDACRAVLRVAPSARAWIDERLSEAWDRNITTEWSGDELAVHAIGKAAHGSTPFAGDSAGIRVLRFLKEIAPLDQELAYKAFFEASHIGGAGIGIAGSDEVSDDLTCNLGIVETVGNCARFTFNIRYPVTWQGNGLRDRILARLDQTPAGPSLVSFNDSPPLYFPVDHPLVQTILDVHEAETGERGTPGVMGGGTYARAIPNTVSVGTGWEGDGNAHETDERLKIDSLYRMSRIYAHILYRLALA